MFESGPAGSCRNVTSIDIIRVFNKDLTYRYYLFQKAINLSCSVLGREITSNIQAEIGLVSDFLYYGASIARGEGTPGEEYCGLFLRTEEGGNVSKMNTFLVMCLETLPFYLRKRLDSWSKARRDTNPILRKNVEFLLTEILPGIDCALSIWFFIERGYITLPKALFKMKYELSPESYPYHGSGYFLSAIRLAHLCAHVYKNRDAVRQLLKFIKKFLRFWKKQREEQETDEDLMESTDHPRCSMCLNTCNVPTSTPCGHLFCWDCVARWCTTKPMCPMCRRPCGVNQLLPIWNYSEDLTEDSLEKVSEIKTDSGGDSTTTSTAASTVSISPSSRRHTLNPKSFLQKEAVEERRKRVSL